MSTIAGIYFMRTTSQDIPSTECPIMESDTNLNLSEDENTSCSNSEMGCDLSLAASNNNNKPTSNLTSSPTPLSSGDSPFSSSSRKNKRKNFKPRNITEYAGSDEEDHQQTGGTRDRSGMKLRQRLSAQQPQRRQEKYESEDDDQDDHMKKEEEEVEDENHHHLITSSRNGFAQDEDDDENEAEMLDPDVGTDALSPKPFHHRIIDNSSRGSSGGDFDRRSSPHFSHNVSQEDLRQREQVVQPPLRDGPLDLSEVQNADCRRLWKREKPDSSSIHSAIQSLMTNLNNNIDPLSVDPSSYLSHQVAMAAAAAAAAGNNPAAHATISGLHIMGLPGAMGVDLRLGRNHLLDGLNNPAGGDPTSAGSNSSSNHGGSGNSHHLHYNLRRTSSCNNNSDNNAGGSISNLNNNSGNELDDEDDQLGLRPRRPSSTPDQTSSRKPVVHAGRSSVSPNSCCSTGQLHHELATTSGSGSSPQPHQHTPTDQSSQLLQSSLMGNSGALNLRSWLNSSTGGSMNDFAESTMKELLSLYGIAENLRQAGGQFPNASDMIANLHCQKREGATTQATDQEDKMMLPVSMARFLAVMQESVVSAAAAAAAAGNQDAGGSADGSSTVPTGIDNGINSSNSGSGNNTGNNCNNTGNSSTGNENSASGTSNINNNASSPSASETPPPLPITQHHQHISSSSPTLILNHQLNQPQLNHQQQSHQPLNFANISSLVQQPLVSSVGSPNQNSKPSPPSHSPAHHLSSGSMGNHHGGSLFGSGVASALLKSAKARSAGRNPTGRGLTAFPVIREGLLGKGSGPVDYTRYVRRYGNSSECGYHHCRELNYREHFHCLDCSSGSRVFVKKEEMIRHFKWHKKRDESLQHGFMRYSPMDDCSDRFINCQHNRKQTHYHCLKDNCEKVYISTSDVQMHANYHRKDSAIIQEGFQRFRAVEDCANDSCAFRHQRTTHFHCRRPSCSYTFKNKADMEKHKSYHVKDEQLNRDGFKKFMKHETCNYGSCRFSRVCNHIHCIREGCNYVLHSSGQLYSHKRKHERRDSELAYRRFKLAQSLMRGTLAAEISGMGISDSLLGSKSEDENNSRSSFNENSGTEAVQDSEEAFKKFMQMCSCEVASEDHFHCKVDVCRNILLRSAEIAADHSRTHEIEERISSLAFFTVDPANFDAQDSTIPCISAKCPFQSREKHYHCLWDGCTEIVLATGEPFRRFEHFRTHQYTQKLEGSDKEGTDNMDGFFRRKRGRPPKNRVIEVSSGAHDTAIFTSFKLPKPVPPGASGTDGSDPFDIDVKDPFGFLSFPEGVSCPDPSCPYHQQTSTCHYHCGHPRCHFSAADVHKLSNHLRDFHSNVDILDGYAYYDRNTDCKDGKCEFRNSTDHFHCTRDGLKFVQYAVMMTHEAEAHENSKSTPTSDDDDDSSSLHQWNNQVIKASGTFFPGSMTPSENVSTNNNNPMDLSSPNGSAGQPESKSLTDHSLSRILQLHSSTENPETQFGPEVPCGRAFCKLKKKHHYHCTLCNQAFSELDKLRPHVLKHSSFSPLKQVDAEHFTDDEGGKPDSDEHRVSPDQMKPSISHSAEELFGKHALPGSVIPPSGLPPSSLPNFLNCPTSQSPFSHLFLQQNPFSLYGMMFGGAPPGVFQPGGLLGSPAGLPQPHQLPSSSQHLGVVGGVPGSTPGPLVGLNMPDSVAPLLVNSSFQQQLQKAAAASGVGGKRPLTPPTSSSPSSPPGDGGAKKPRMQLRILKDEPVPTGYIRFRFNEDCNYPHCGYREHQTHFHCTREDCGYSFCDKTRFVQHTARHERLDTLMGGDFKQYRANISCGRGNCSYVPTQGGPQGQNKASHFHCCKCDFVCTDTNKVVAHRRQHQKLDSITAAGFEKFTPSQNCNISSCIHSQKQTHYHCLKCSYAVLGLSQMSAHKYRHADE